MGIFEKYGDVIQVPTKKHTILPIYIFVVQ